MAQFEFAEGEDKTKKGTQGVKKAEPVKAEPAAKKPEAVKAVEAAPVKVSQRMADALKSATPKKPIVLMLDNRQLRAAYGLMP